jgi:hypothetical protein
MHLGRLAEAAVVPATEVTRTSPVLGRFPAGLKLILLMALRVPELRPRLLPAVSGSSGDPDAGCSYSLISHDKPIWTRQQPSLKCPLVRARSSAQHRHAGHSGVDDRDTAGAWQSRIPRHGISGALVSNDTHPEAGLHGEQRVAARSALFCSSGPELLSATASSPYWSRPIWLACLLRARSDAAVRPGIVRHPLPADLRQPHRLARHGTIRHIKRR